MDSGCRVPVATAAWMPRTATGSIQTTKTTTTAKEASSPAIVTVANAPRQKEMPQQETLQPSLQMFGGHRPLSRLWPFLFFLKQASWKVNTELSTLELLANV